MPQCVAIVAAGYCKKTLGWLGGGEHFWLQAAIEHRGPALPHLRGDCANAVRAFLH